MAKVQTYTEWTEKDNALHKTYTFDSFLDAIEWMSDCSSQIDEVEHHPQWTNIYNKVHIILQTHEID
ncbi:hypothetical protein GW750_01195 [bacterium]|nr:hypothetical protein [bacterium]